MYTIMGFTCANMVPIWSSKPNQDCNYAAPIDVAPNGVQFAAKSIEKVKLQSLFGLD